MIRINHSADELAQVRACPVVKLHARAGCILYCCSPNLIKMSHTLLELGIISKAHIVQQQRAGWEKAESLHHHAWCDMDPWLSRLFGSKAGGHHLHLSSCASWSHLSAQKRLKRETISSSFSFAFNPLIRFQNRNTSVAINGYPTNTTQLSFNF